MERLWLSHPVPQTNSQSGSASPKVSPDRHVLVGGPPHVALAATQEDVPPHHVGGVAGRALATNSLSDPGGGGASHPKPSQNRPKPKLEKPFPVRPKVRPDHPVSKTPRGGVPQVLNECMALGHWHRRGLVNPAPPPPCLLQ